MRIIPKLTLALVGGMCVVLGVNGYVRVDRETSAFERERIARHRRAATATSAAMGHAWKRQGEAAAVQTMEGIATGYPSMHVRWIPMSSDDRTRPMAAGPEPFTKVDREHEPSTRFTYVTLVVDGDTKGEVEFSEEMTADATHAREVIIETLKTAALLAALSAILAFVLGEWVVGKPVRALADKARRIGRGEFGGPIALEAADELAELAREMNAMSERLVGTLDQLRHADRLATIGKLAAGVAHELGTPLNVVSARAEMVAASRTSLEESREYARVIGTAVDRMTETISQLPHFARRKSLARAPHDVGELVREAVQLLEPIARKRHIAISVDASPVEAAVDPGQLQQVITNLVMNAIHASRENGRIDVRVSEGVESAPADLGGLSTEVVRVVVEDNGAGIAEEDLPRIFEPFFTTKDVGEGTGLGLAVSYGIVREHQGWLNVESKVGEGSTFTVVVPRGDRR
jgi:two-component system, NtrC family, sensor kinase